jgi:hypothetical protein
VSCLVKSVDDEEGPWWAGTCGGQRKGAEAMLLSAGVPICRGGWVGIEVDELPQLEVKRTAERRC